MKYTKWIIVAAAALAGAGFGISTGNAQPFYPAFVNLFSVSTNISGLTYHFVGNQDLIRDCASQMGVTNTMGLSLAYDRGKDAIEVVSGTTNKVVVCTLLTFNGGVSLSNTNDTKIQRQAYVYWETSTMANGSLVATENQFMDTNGMAFFNLRGQLQFAVPVKVVGGVQYPPVIYTGSVVAGSVLFSQDELPAMQHPFAPGPGN